MQAKHPYQDFTTASLAHGHATLTSKTANSIQSGHPFTSLIATSSLVCTLDPAEKGTNPHFLNTAQTESHDMKSGIHHYPEQTIQRMGRHVIDGGLLSTNHDLHPLIVAEGIRPNTICKENAPRQISPNEPLPILRPSLYLFPTRGSIKPLQTTKEKLCLYGFLFPPELLFFHRVVAFSYPPKWKESHR